MGALIVLLICLPVAEVASVIWVAHQVGALATVGLLLAVSIAGCSLAKRVGLEVWRRFRATLAAGDIPSGEVSDGALVLLAAGLLAVPGFLTDVLGLLLLVPAVRSLVKLLFWRRLRRRMIEVTEVRRRRVAPIRVQAIRVGDAPPEPPASLPD